MLHLINNLYLHIIKYVFKNIGLKTAENHDFEFTRTSHNIESSSFLIEMPTPTSAAQQQISQADNDLIE